MRARSEYGSEPGGAGYRSLQRVASRRPLAASATRCTAACRRGTSPSGRTLHSRRVGSAYASPACAFRQFVDDDLGCASYLIGDEQAGRRRRRRSCLRDRAVSGCGEAPRGRARRRPRDAHARRPRLGSRPARARARPARARARRGRRGVSARARSPTGRRSSSARSCIRTIHTPGHRPEHCAFAVIDRSRGDEPWLVLTGDSLFVGDAARPDLAVEARDGAEGLFHSLHRLVELGDGVEVYPGHVAGSLCGAAMSSKPSTTIGFERRFNHALAESYRTSWRAQPGRSRRGRRTWRRSSS